ncbi:M48 family metalloprotease [Uliginosibacterium sp. H3]|uniref:M48 family metalloprotease n=1 Tax=Uliginosibacterium silvisoli TaxID=3114758 RepID=A0ABU6K229_9RHOO|nr:M48 family metalloprotease [Uliginosibacterium sp. H3]
MGQLRRLAGMAMVVGVLACAVASTALRAAPVFDLQPNPHWKAELRVTSAELLVQREAEARKANAYGCEQYCALLADIFERVVRVATYQVPGGADHDWQLIVTRMPGEEAWSLPDGHVFISEDFIRRNKLDAEQIAFVIAHEVSHVVLAHEADTVDIVRRLVPFGVSASVSDVYATLDFDMGLLLRLAPMMSDMELEADRTGLMFAALAGYDPDRASGFLRKLAAGEQHQAVVATHPEDPRRLAEAQQFLPIARRLYALHDTLGLRAGSTR